MKNCVDCNKKFECLNPKIRCCRCQKAYRKKYNKANRKKNQYKHQNQWITRLGGQEITLEEIRNYKGGIAPNSPMGNEAEYRSGSETGYSEQYYYGYSEQCEQCKQWFQELYNIKNVRVCWNCRGKILKEEE